MSTIALGFVFAYFLVLAVALIAVIVTVFQALSGLVNFIMKRIK